MNIPKLNDNLNTIQSLPDSPTMQASELKSQFDKAANIIKNFLNNILAPELEKVGIKRNIKIDGAVTGNADFDGTTDITIPITDLDVSKANIGILPVTRGGTGMSAVQEETLEGTCDIPGVRIKIVCRRIGNIVDLKVLTTIPESIETPEIFNNITIILPIWARVSTPPGRGFSFSIDKDLAELNGILYSEGNMIMQLSSKDIHRSGEITTVGNIMYIVD